MSYSSFPRINSTSSIDSLEEMVEEDPVGPPSNNLISEKEVDPVDEAVRRFTICYLLNGCDLMNSPTHRCKYQYFSESCSPMTYRIACAFSTLGAAGCFLAPVAWIGACYIPKITTLMATNALQGYATSYGIALSSSCTAAYGVGTPICCLNYHYGENDA